MEKVTILIPCLNEEKAIGHVINNVRGKSYFRHGYMLEVIVIDNNSTDRTAEVARDYGVTVIKEKRRGKGYALRRGLSSLSPDTKYVVVIDGDNTYKPYEVFRLLEPLKSNFCDVTLGSRISGKIISGSLTFSHRAVNWMFSFMVRFFYHANITDVLSGFFALKRNVADEMLQHLESNDFTIEMELMTKVARRNFSIYSLPITYDQRIGHSKLDSFKDGTKILQTLFGNLFWSPKKSRHLSNNLNYDNRFSI